MCRRSNLLYWKVKFQKVLIKEPFFFCILPLKILCQIYVKSLSNLCQIRFLMYFSKKKIKILDDFYKIKLNFMSLTRIYSYGEIGQLLKWTPNLPSIDMGIGDRYVYTMEGIGEKARIYGHFWDFFCLPCHLSKLFQLFLYFY